MTDPYSVTLSGGAPWGIRISGGREFGTPIILNHIVVNGKAHLGGIKTGTEFLSFTPVYIGPRFLEVRLVHFSRDHRQPWVTLARSELNRDME